jgi:hypothetical protein
METVHSVIGSCDGLGVPGDDQWRLKISIRKDELTSDMCTDTVRSINKYIPMIGFLVKRYELTNELRNREIFVLMEVPFL